MTKGRKNKYFFESKDSDALNQIIDSHSLDSDVEDTQDTHQSIVQYQVSDWDFCIARSQANGKICLPDDETIKIKSPAYNDPESLSLSFGSSILDLDAEIDARNQFSNVVTSSWDKANQFRKEKTGVDPSTNLSGNLQIDDLASVINLEKAEYKNGGSATDAELQQWADSKVLMNQLSKVRGRVKFQGNDQIKPDTVIELTNVGDRFSGNHYVSGIRHQITEGNWTVDAQLGIDPEWFTKQVNIDDEPAAGLLAAVNGLQIGIVTQLENDPDGEGRIQVRLPMVSSDQQGIWTRIATLDAGSNRGSFFLPEIEDEVIVGFINDDPRDAIVLGMMNSSAKPPPLTAADDNHEKGIFTRSGMKLLFNDDKNAVLLETPGGKKISVDEDRGIIQLEDENSNKVVLDSSGIELNSDGDIKIKATGDINIEGSNVNLKATASFKAEGSSGAEMSTSAMAVIKGSMVQIN